MPRSENQKIKTLLVAKIIQEISDENHPFSAKDITDALDSDYGISAEKKSIYRDIAFLRDVYGMDIEGTQGGRYRLLSHDFAFDDLRLLAECVYSTKFISESKAQSLVETISHFCSIYEAELLQGERFLADRVKTTKTHIMNTISTINSAMAAKWDGKPHTPTKISFQYMKYSINDVKKEVERRKGAKYIVSPYKLLINDGNYYLLAYSDQAKDMLTFRVDRMKRVDILVEPRAGAEVFKDIDLANYTKRVFSMFGGDQKRVKMRFINPLLDTVIERFGTGSDVFYMPDGDNHFIVIADVQISDQFFSWICGFRKKAAIQSPPEVVEGMKAFLQDITDRYNGY